MRATIAAWGSVRPTGVPANHQALGGAPVGKTRQRRQAWPRKGFNQDVAHHSWAPGPPPRGFQNILERATLPPVGLSSEV